MRLVLGEQEREKLYRFRYRVYVEEVQFTQDADHSHQRLVDDYDEVAHSFAIFDGPDIVGSLRLLYFSQVKKIDSLVEKFRCGPALLRFGPKALCSTSRFMVDPQIRNGKAIFKLMRTAFAHALEQGARLNFGDCSPHMIPFYEHMGYRRYTSGFNDSQFGFKIPILMLFRDHVGFAEVRSIMLRLSQSQPDDREARDWFTQTYPDYVSVRSAVFLQHGVFLDLLTERLAQDPAHHVTLLKGLDPAEAQQFLSEATIFPMSVGDMLIRKGDTGGSVFVLLKGLAEVKAENPDKPALAILGAGDTFGEMGFLTASPRSANVVAQTQGEVLVLTSDFIQRFIRRNSAAAAKVMFNLARELAARLSLTSRQDAG